MAYDEIKLAELASYISRGITPSYTDTEGICVINQKCIRNGALSLAEARLHNESKKAVPVDKIVQPMDILVNSTGTGTLGRVAQVTNNIRATVDSHVTIVRPATEVDPLFLGYAVKWRKPYIEALAEGSTGQTELSRFRLGDEITIPFPPLAVQKQIAETLYAIDCKININNRINDNLQQQAFTLFDKLIIDADNDDCTVSDYACLNPKRVLAKNQIARSIDMSQLSTSGAFPSGWDMKPFNGGMRFANGDTLLARITPCLENGKTAFVDFLDENEVAFGSTEYIVLAPRNGAPPEMLYCLARYPAFIDYAVKNMNGSSGRQRVSAETIGQYQLPKFDEHGLSAFGDTVTPMFLKMRYNSLQNMRLAELRDALLPKFMSGEIDVSEINL